MITKSLAISSLFPQTLESAGALRDTLRYIAGRGFSMAEFWTPPDDDKAVAALLKEYGFSGVLIAVYPLKKAGFSLCAVDEAERRQAAEVLKKCLDRGAAMGCRSVLINSGFIPKDPSLIETACGCYVQSIAGAYDYIAARGYDIEITLEPGDSGVQSFQLLGPVGRVTATAKQIQARNPGYGLTMDVAHIREEGEDVLSSLEAAEPYCSHIHLCNCLMGDPAHPMYGDKHIDFDYPGACFGYADFKRMYEAICALYGGRDFIITLEALCRAEDNKRWFDEVISNFNWL